MEVDQQQQEMSHPPKNISVLLADDMTMGWMQAIVAVKNDVIGSNREKNKAIQYGLIPRMLRWVEEETGDPELRTQAAIVLASIARGDAAAINALIDNKSVPVLLRFLVNLNLRYLEASLRCLRSIFTHNSDVAPCLYEESVCGITFIPHLLSLLHCSVVCQECITSILERGCQDRIHQMCLLESGALPILAPLLMSEFYKVQMPTLRCFANLCFKNKDVCHAVLEEKNLITVFVELMSRDKPSEMQIAAAKVLTYLHRGGAIPALDYIISRKTLGTLVRMCKRDRPLEENVKGAETLACLIELDPELQMIASVTDHLISTLANYLQFKDVKRFSSAENKEVDWGSEMKRAAFLAFASITANDEEIREKVIKREGFMEQIQASLCSSNQPEAMASLKCLHSLTRSVQQIRTVLHDGTMWKPIVDMMRSEDRQMKLLAMSCMCNITLEFSPSREVITENNALRLLADLSGSDDAAERFNAAWCFMSMAYGAVDPLYEGVIHGLGPEMLRKLVLDELPCIREKGLGIVRNLLTHKQVGAHNIDKAAKLLGNKVIDAVFDNIRDTSQPIEVITQALCVASNMADGPSCKGHIITKTEDISAVIQYLQIPDQRVQLPAIQFVSNLVDSSDDDYGSFPGAGSYQRMLALKALDVHQLLESLIGTSAEEVEKRAHHTLKCFA